MKIHPYLTVIQGHRTGTGRRAQGKVGATEFSVPVRTSTIARTRDLVEIVSLENRKASIPAPPGDVGQAEQVLERVKDDLGRMTKIELRNLHRLEGLVHVFKA